MRSPLPSPTCHPWRAVRGRRFVLVKGPPRRSRALSAAAITSCAVDPPRRPDPEVRMGLSDGSDPAPHLQRRTFATTPSSPICW